MYELLGIYCLKHIRFTEHRPDCDFIGKSFQRCLFCLTDLTVTQPLFMCFFQLADARGAEAVGHVERFAFYEEAKNCYCILQSGESAIYANVILQKGVIK